MELETPEWLTKEYVKLALEDGKRTKSDGAIIVEEIAVDKPIAKGDNYVCEIFRVKVTYRKSSNESESLKTSLIVKAPITTGLHEVISSMGVHKKEVSIYDEYLPKLYRFLRESHSLTARSYYSDKENVLVLGDLTTEGYIMADRRKQLDYEHCVVALKTLALYHAASVKLHEQDPEFIEKIGEETFIVEKAKGTLNEFTKFTFSMLAERSKSLPDMSRYSEAFTKYIDTAWDLLIKVMAPKENALNVLTHGDFWVNNMMFRYENEKPVGLKLVDFQLSRYTSPAVELMYFFNGSVQEDIKDKMADVLMRIYLEELNANLEKFEVSVDQRLTEQELKHMMGLCDFFGLFVTLSLLPIVMADPNECTVEMKELKQEDLLNHDSNPFIAFYKNEKFLIVLKKRLREFEEKGLL